MEREFCTVHSTEHTVHKQDKIDEECRISKCKMYIQVFRRLNFVRIEICTYEQVLFSLHRAQTGTRTQIYGLRTKRRRRRRGRSRAKKKTIRKRTWHIDRRCFTSATTELSHVNFNWKLFTYSYKCVVKCKLDLNSTERQLKAERKEAKKKTV